MLHDTAGVLVRARVVAGSVMVMNGSTPHVLHSITDILTGVSFGFLCYAVYRVYRRTAPGRARYLGPMTALLAVATLLDTINEHSIITTFTTLYLTQLCFALVIVAVSLALRRESLLVERELQMYRTQMDALVEARVAELDEANEQLALEAKERRATEAVLRRRLEELAALQRLAQILAGRVELGRAIDEVTRVITTLFDADYARVRLLADLARGDDDLTGARVAAGRRWRERGETIQPLTELDLAFSDGAMHDGATIAQDAASWPGLEESLRRQGRRRHRPRAGGASDRRLGPGGRARHRTERPRWLVLRRRSATCEDRLRGVDRRHRDGPPAPQGDQAGGRGGAPGARP